MTNENKIPDSWHKEYAFNCLTEEHFKELQEKHRIDDEFSCECQDCGTYGLDYDHRCDCDNRRCYFIKEGDRFIIACD